ncbi:MAG: carbohydrate ABC transporter permease [Clostridiales bacterium]|nr:carbohydrate ABC transporter permease [Clostridiales bacterium]
MKSINKKMSGGNIKQYFSGYGIFTFFNYIFLSLVAVITLYPFYFVVVASFSDPGELQKYTGLLIAPVGKITFSAYELVFKNPMVGSGYLNTLFILAVGVSINIVMTIIGAYFLSLKRVMFKKYIMIFIIFTMYFSGGMIPSYLNIRELHLLDSIWSLILPGAVSTINIIILRTAFDAIPDSLIEAARIDGASHYKIMWKIMVPLSKATLAVLVLYYGVGHWNSWFSASIYLRTPSKYPLQLVLHNILLANQSDSMTGSVGLDEASQLANLIKYALIVVSTVPILAVYPFLQKYFTKGVMIGAIKE